MKHLNWGLIGVVILCLAIILLAGCGVPQSEYEALQAEKANLETELTAVQTELTAVQADLTSLHGDYDTLNADYQAASNELAQIKEVYPPRDFSSFTELEDWLLANDVSDRPVTEYASAWYRKALEIQEDALKDGYTISADYDYDAKAEIYYVFCVTIIDGDIWYWDPETDEPQVDTFLGKVK